MTDGLVLIRGGETTDASDSLDALACRARAAHAAVQRHASGMLRSAVDAGEALIAAKAQAGHGSWMDWLRENFPASPDTAELYMRLARNSERVRNLPEGTSIRAALDVLSGHRPQKKRNLWSEWLRVVGEISGDGRRAREPGYDLGAYEPFPQDPEVLRQEIAGCEARLARLREMLAGSERDGDSIPAADRNPGTESASGERMVAEMTDDELLAVFPGSEIERAA